MKKIQYLMYAGVAIGALEIALHPVLAADNQIIITQGSGTTMRSKDIGGGVQSMMPIPGDVAGNPLATAPGSGNSSYALPIQGVAGGIAVPISGTIAAITAPVSITGSIAAIITNTVTVTGSIAAITNPVTVSGTLSILNVNPNGATVSAASSPVALATNTVLPWTGSTGSTAPTSASLDGFIAANAEPSAASNGQMVGAIVGLEGKQIMLPYSVKEKMVRGANYTTGTTATVLTGMASVSGVHIYMTDLECSRNDSGTVAVVVTLNDGATTSLVIPNNGGGGGNNEHYSIPLQVATGTAATFQPSSSVSSVVCSAQGYYGT
jgi:hypothetical protein